MRSLSYAYRMKRALSETKLFFFDYISRLRYGIVYGAEGIANLGTKEAHNTNHNNCHKSEDDRIFDQALTSFF